MKRKTTEEFCKELYKVDPKITVLGKYINNRTKIKVQCSGCSKNCIGESTPSNLLNNIKSATCKKIKLSTTSSISEDDIKLKLEDTVFTLVEYSGKATSGGTVICDHGHLGKVNSINQLFRRPYCPYCKGTLKDITDYNFATVHPELVKYFVDEFEAVKYKPNSNKKILTKCPCCNRTKLMSITNLAKRGFSCKYCTVNISFPNLVIKEVLLQLSDTVSKLNFEYSPEGLKPLRYDAYFEIENNKYAIEMQGNQHFKQIGTGDLNKQRYNDTLKRDLSVQNNVHEIEINAITSDFNYLKAEIINSDLAKVLNLEALDGTKVSKNLKTPLLLKIIETYDMVQSVDNTAKLMRIAKPTVTKYLKRAVELGIPTSGIPHKNYYKNKVN